MQTLRNILQHVINVFTELVLNPEQSFIKLRNTCKRRLGSSSMIWTPPPSPAPGRWRQQARLFALGNWHKACGITHTHGSWWHCSGCWCEEVCVCVSAVSPVVAVDGGDSPGTVGVEAHPLQLSFEPPLVSSCKHRAKHTPPSGLKITWILTLHTHQIYKTQFVCFKPDIGLSLPVAS